MTTACFRNYRCEETGLADQVVLPLNRSSAFRSLVGRLALGGALGISSAFAAALPSPATTKVDFARDIQPLFVASCVQCHGKGKAKGSFSLETRADFLEGGDEGPAVILGKSAESRVVELIASHDPETVMPKKGKKLTAEQIALFRAWIDQGLEWPDSINFFKQEPANLRPQPSALSLSKAPAGSTHPLDALVERYFTAQKSTWPMVVDDRTYARRVWLDTIGLPPTPEELAAFVADPDAGKRAKLVHHLLSDNQGYAEHWLTFWNDLLRNDYKGPGYIDGGRKSITAWLYSALAQNLPYDQFVAQLLDPGAAAEGFTRGILWRGAVSASLVPPMQAAQGISQIFLGVNLKCASCHDSFINEYTLDDAYGLATIYSDGPLEIAECDKPTGVIAKAKFLYSEIGAIETTSSPEKRRLQLVEIITGRKNGRLPRTIINRLWQRLMGRGLVEPVDEMDKPAWSPELLDWLAEDFVAHGYDLKHTIGRILSSRVYQLHSRGLTENEENFVFRGPVLRRMSAEQFVDALYSIGDLRYAKLEAKLNRNFALNPSGAALPLRPSWIWSSADAAQRAKPATLIFKKTVTLSATPTLAHLAICADDNYTIEINGKRVAVSARRNVTNTDWIDVSEHLGQGDNAIEITCDNMPPDEGRLVSIRADTAPEADSPAGMILYAQVNAGETVMDFVSDDSWSVWAFPEPPSDDRFALTRGAPTEMGPAVKLGGVDLAPWKLGTHFLDVAAAPKDSLPVERASLMSADSLMLALGRPNREQFTTVRQTAATTLQALELTNGRVLAGLLGRAAKNIVSSTTAESGTVVEVIYQRTLGRSPTSAEKNAAVGLVGTPVRTEGVEDLLWSLTMLPEFQLIL